MTGTTAFDLKDAFIARLEADATIAALNPKPAINYGFTTGPFPEQAIEVGEVLWDDEEYAGASTKRDEKYHLIVAIHSHLRGDDQRTANARVRAIGQAIEASIKDPRWSGISGVTPGGFVPQLLTEGVDTEGRGAIWVVRVYITARI